MATRPLPEAAAHSPEIIAEPVAPSSSAIAAFAESRWIPLPPELAQPQALPSGPTRFLHPAEPLPDPAPLPNPAAGAKPSQPPTLLQILFFATVGVMALVAVLVLADHSRGPDRDYRVGYLLTGTPKPSADGEPFEPQPAHHSRTPAPARTDSEPDPPDSAASPDTSAQPAPAGDDDPSPAPAEPPQTNESPPTPDPTPDPPAN
jgi:hypothetical protein